ncbi:MerR family DNA-binding transcriptional regulator [Phenylobacterium sp.]|uniref:MerR family transcriptional regulator n=1 Tax=Phenylobacterium sp. TaxID=1871053 RepID=UPI0027354AC2|nr:MerR family DNA-binding transcriptional regulator [Phenylobacterium sp.]MDP3661124.1 MerR family DNA-binding transcriptional regulator [Phenylobacterium sp.]
MDKELRQPCRTFTIRQLCQEFDCTPRALRFYEDKGLLSPTRDGMNRIYSHKDRGRLILILRGKRVGLALAEIREILDLYSAGDGGEAQLIKSADKFRERVRALEEQKTDIDGAIDHLRESIAFCERSLTTLRTDGHALEDQFAPALPRRMEGVEAK